MKTLLYVAGGGALGALLRHGINLLIKPENTFAFPLHTFLINIAGCFAIGLSYALITRNSNQQMIQLFVVTGILGGFTTFSSYAMENVQFISNDHIKKAFVYVFLSNLTGIAAAWGGFNVPKIFS